MIRNKVDLERAIAQNGETVFIDSKQNFKKGDLATFKPPYQYMVKGPMSRNDISASPEKMFDGEVPINYKILDIVLESNI